MYFTSTTYSVKLQKDQQRNIINYITGFFVRLDEDTTVFLNFYVIYLVFYFYFIFFDFESTWFRFPQKHLVHIKFDIYVFITTSVFLLLVSPYHW